MLSGHDMRNEGEQQQQIPNMHRTFELALCHNRHDYNRHRYRCVRCRCRCRRRYWY